MTVSIKEPPMPPETAPLRNVRTNIVQSIRAFHVPDLQRYKDTRGWLFDVGEPHDEKVMNREIGRLLHISEHTAANHVRSILRKTRSANRTEAAGYAMRRGLVPD